MNRLWRRYLRFWGTDIDREVDDELKFHLDALVAQYECSGMPRDDAERAAKARLGDLAAVRNEVVAHDRAKGRRLDWSDRIARLRADVRVAVRSLRRTPTFTIATTAILALAIGTTSAMFTIYRIVIADQLPVGHQGRLAVLHLLDRRGTELDCPYSYLPVIARNNTLFADVAATYHKGALPAPLLFGSRIVTLATVLTSGNYFDVLEARPALGRLLRKDDGDPGAPLVAVLSHDAWVRNFASDSSIVGKFLTGPYSHEDTRIVGVAPAGLGYPAGTDVWFSWPADTSLQHLQVDLIARLAPHVTLAAARDGLLALTHRVNPFVSSYPTEKLSLDTYEIHDVAASLFADTVLGGTRPSLVALTLAVALLLLIACVNVANLVFVRLVGRSREIAVRRAIGASFGDLALLFAIENIIIVSIGAVAGAAIAVGLLHASAMLAPSQLARHDVLDAAGVPLWCTAAVAVFALAIFGFVPSLVAPRLAGFDNLRATTRGATSGQSGRRMRRGLVATQMALALMLLAGAALLVRTVSALTSLDLGYQPDHLYMLSFTLPQAVAPTRDRVFSLAHEIVAGLEAQPGVVAASPIESMPFKGTSIFITQIGSADQPASARERNPFVPYECVGPDYFRTLNIPVRRGREFLSSDTRGSNKVAIVNETLAGRMWPGQEPIGKRFVNTYDKTQWTVVGVVRDTRYRDLEATEPVVYYDWDQVEPFWGAFIAVRATMAAGVAIPVLRAAAAKVNPQLIVWDAKSMDDLLGGPTAQSRIATVLLVGVSLAALILAAIGLYGMISSVVQQQRRELGIRIALGATSRDVLRLVLDDALRTIAVGAVFGLAGAVLAGRALQALLYGVSPLDPVAVIAAVATLAAVGLIASYVPARRVDGINPSDVLRSE